MRLRLYFVPVTKWDMDILVQLAIVQINTYGSRLRIHDATRNYHELSESLRERLTKLFVLEPHNRKV